jgi:opacity protein-like surface antigen
MRNFLLLAGVMSLLISSPAQAERYYRGDDGYYYVESVNQPKVQYVDEDELYKQDRAHYSKPKYTRSSTKYERVNAETARQYQEKRTYKEDYSVNKIRPYIGFDLGRTYAKFTDTDAEFSDEYNEVDNRYGLYNEGVEKDWKDKNSFISGVVGLQVNKNFGFEVFYQQSDTARKKSSNAFNLTEFTLQTTKQNTSWQYSAYGVDFLGYLPVNQDFELLASLGLAQYNFKAKQRVSNFFYNTSIGAGLLVNSEDEKISDDSLGCRLGLGVQYNINQHLALRAMARYIKMNDDENIRRLTEISLGLRYMF